MKPYAASWNPAEIRRVLEQIKARSPVAESDFVSREEYRAEFLPTSAAAVADALSNPTDIASASGTAGSTAQRPTPHPADDPTTDLAGGTSGPALHSRREAI